MRFIYFIKQLPNQSDNDLQAFISWAKKCKNFPLSSSPYSLTLFLYNKLNPQQTFGYKKALMVYSVQPKNMLPKELSDKQKFIEAINLIDVWQESKL